MVDELLFHTARELYVPGNRVTPRWGAVVLGTGPNHRHFFREYLFERIRVTEFPDRPSRMTSTFAFAIPDSAEVWRQQAEDGGEGPHFVYAVRAADKAASWKTDMSWITELRGWRTFDGVEEVARAYWRGDIRDPAWLEALVDGQLEVVHRLTPIPDNGVQ